MRYMFTCDKIIFTIEKLHFSNEGFGQMRYMFTSEKIIFTIGKLNFSNEGFGLPTGFLLTSFLAFFPPLLLVLVLLGRHDNFGFIVLCGSLKIVKLIIL
jgi:hypothetical protein